MATKKAWQSKTNWGALITLVSAGLLVFGVEISAETQESISASTMQIIGGIGEIIGFVTVIYGRYHADKKIA